MSTRTNKTLRKIADNWDIFPFFNEGINAGALLGGFTGLAGATLDWLRTAKDPQLRKSTVKRIASALAKGILYGGTGFAAGYGINRLGELAGKSFSSQIINTPPIVNAGVTIPETIRIAGGGGWDSKNEPINIKLSK